MDRNLVIQFTEFCFHVDETGKDSQNFRIGGTVQVTADMLFHVTEYRAAGLIDISGIRRIFSRQCFKECCFAGTIHTDQTNPVILLNFKRNSLKNHICTKTFFKIAGAK